ncbi:rod shape-determining protein MreD [Pullulanibacillus camelliae]|uniref:Rod shape-determining protein MreD n=1 Tax=Pullulanibacillus camelliae TaxID=1707096 RepID=A0A8J2YHE2_9BACL|nr:rod shape-determining protein MreD [Pullulanibacillus camelliae]GGE42676.1 rod shape-determining protein MreD [Pullulanibacillus camelliae]
MKQVKLFIVLLVFLLLQGTVFQVFSLRSFGYNLIAAPHFILIGVLMIGFFYSRTIALRYALIFGFLIDLVYTDVWGVYAFCITITTYVLLLVGKHFNTHIVIILLTAMIATLLLDMEVYGIYTLIGIAKQNFTLYTHQHLAPTLILNSVFTVICFYPLRALCERLKES